MVNEGVGLTARKPDHDRLDWAIGQDAVTDLIAGVEESDIPWLQRVHFSVYFVTENTFDDVKYLETGMHVCNTFDVPGR